MPRDWIKEHNLAEAETCLKKARRKDKSERADWIELLIAHDRNPAAAIPKALAFAASARHPRLCFQALRLAVDPMMEREDEAGIMKALDAFLAAHPKSSGAWEAAIIRQAYRLMNQKVGAEDLAEVRRLQANPLPGQEARARTLLGQYLMELRKPEEVVELIEPVLKTEPTIINHFQLGTALAALGEKEDALLVLQEGVEAPAGDLAESQVELLKSKMQALIQDLQEHPEPQA